VALNRFLAEIGLVCFVLAYTQAVWTGWKFWAEQQNAFLLSPKFPHLLKTGGLNGIRPYNPPVFGIMGEFISR
jgi:hypothetical protein